MNTKKPQRILVVDDTEPTRYAIARVLRADGFEIIEAGTGTEALKLAREVRPDLITLDIHLPDMLGFEVCRRLKSDKVTQLIPVLQVSASYVTSKDKILGLEGGADSYLTHPVEPPVLIATVRALLRYRNLNEQLERSEEQLRIAVDSASMGLWDRDPTTDVYSFSRRALEIYGFKSDDKVSTAQIVARIHPDDSARIVSSVEAALDPKGSGLYEQQHRAVLPDGQIRWVIGRGQTLFSGEGDSRVAKRFVGTIIDITERKNAEVQLQEAKAFAESANHAKTQFLANISHEVRTPLGVILGLSELIQTESPSAETASGYVKVIQRNAEVLSKLIDEILDLSKIEADRLEVETIAFRPRELVSEVAALLVLKAQEKSLDLKVSYSGPLAEVIMGDPTRLRQILINLIGNSIKFTERGAVELLVSAQAPTTDQTDNQKQNLRFDVIDTGLGVTGEQQKRLFQAFMQADSSTTRRFGGSGLGLMLSRRLAVAMGGDLVLSRTEPGKGSEFSLTLTVGLPSKLEVKELNSRPSEIKERDPGLQPLRGMKVLLVEDSPDNQMMIRRFLDLEGAAVEIANNGEEGVARATSASYDIVLMDIQMPTVDGYEAVQRLRKLDYRGPIVALTAHALKGERERCLEMGFTDYMTKPLNRVRLVALLTEHAPASKA